MSYVYTYNEGFNQFGIINYNLNLRDSDSILPEINLPVVINESEVSDDLLNKIAVDIIQQNSITQCGQLVEEV